MTYVKIGTKLIEREDIENAYDLTVRNSIVEGQLTFLRKCNKINNLTGHKKRMCVVFLKNQNAIITAVPIDSILQNINGQDDLFVKIGSMIVRRSDIEDVDDLSVRSSFMDKHLADLRKQNKLKDITGHKKRMCAIHIKDGSIIVTAETIDTVMNILNNSSKK